MPEPLEQETLDALMLAAFYHDIMQHGPGLLINLVSTVPAAYDWLCDTYRDNVLSAWRERTTTEE